MTVSDTNTPSSRSHIEVKQLFLGFIPVLSCKCIYVRKELQEMKLEVDNLRGQDYDRGSNIKVKDSCIQNDFKYKRTRVFFLFVYLLLFFYFLFWSHTVHILQIF